MSSSVPDPRPNSLTVGIVGLGYVGLGLAAAYVEAGIEVLGFDSSVERLATLSAGRSPVAHLDPRAWNGRAGSRARLEPVADFERAATVDVLFLCLPTPLGADGLPDLSACSEVAERLGAHLRPNQTVVNCSTTWPGATREVLQPLLELGGLKVEQDLFLAHSPEREDPGRQEPRTSAIPRVVGAAGPRSLERARAALEPVFDELVEVESCEVAEAAKLFENVFRAVNISLATEFAQVCRGMGIDGRAALEAAGTKPFGFLPFAPGPGPGGHCIPIDPHYLTYAARRAGVPATLVELAAAINARQPSWVAERLLEALSSRQVRSIGARVLVLGVAYKPDVEDCRESPAFPILEALRVRGVEVSYWDVHVPALGAAQGDCPEPLRDLTSVALDTARLAGADAVLLLTPHTALDLDAVAEHARFVVDTRGVLRGRMAGSEQYLGL